MSMDRQETKSQDAVPRNIILCFDGTGNMFGDQNSNVVKFVSALVKDKPKEQIVYYQPGIGTYNNHQLLFRTASALSSVIEQGIALHIDEHVKEGYQFIMRNYQAKDKIFLFGFSRGAHTARVVAGMLYKVGLMHAHNDQQLDFAFSVYQTTGPKGIELSRQFKKTFSIAVTVEFVGVWDTVSSVGIIPKSHPYTSVNYAVKTFRHALALDERRARFRPQTWNEPTLEREHDLDVDDPLSIIKQRGSIPRDDWEYEPASRTKTDVKEVWFAGAHADIGGGSHSNMEESSLSFIPLRWMIKECILANTGILFDPRALSSFAFDFQEVQQTIEQEQGAHVRSPVGFVPKPQIQNILPTENPALDLSAPISYLATRVLSLLDPTQTLGLSGQRVKGFTKDSVAIIWDQLDQNKGWWFLEMIPTLAVVQRPDGVWVRRRLINQGQGRHLPFTRDGQVLVHKSVEERIQNAEHPYLPKAQNWKMVVDTGMITYVS